MTRVKQIGNVGLSNHIKYSRAFLKLNLLSYLCDKKTMGNSKSEEFSLRDNRIAGYAKALSHPARVAILRFLSEQNSCMCGDIVNELPLSQSTVSQHLKELKSAGLVVESHPEFDARGRVYALNGHRLADLKDWLARAERG